MSQRKNRFWAFLYCQSLAAISPKLNTFSTNNSIVIMFVCCLFLNIPMARCTANIADNTLRYTFSCCTYLPSSIRWSSRGYGSYHGKNTGFEAQQTWAKPPALPLSKSIPFSTFLKLSKLWFLIWKKQTYCPHKTIVRIKECIFVKQLACLFSKY